VDPKTQYPPHPPAEPPAEAELHEQQSPVENNLQRVLPDTTYGSQTSTRSIGLRHASIAIALLLLASSVWWFFLRAERELHAAAPAAYAPSTTGRNDTTSAVFAPPGHSVAVLPFTNLSGDPKQEYFSDGVTEELTNSLSQIDGLKVTARTSSFFFKGKDTDIGTIARKLNVAAVLEGSVRRSGNQVRITAQLVNTVSGFHIWSHDYDGDLSNVLALQTDIATAVARELQAKLLRDVAPKIELGGTRNPDAFDAYLRGMKAHSSNPDDAMELQIAIAANTEAIRLDPKYALAY
jgi:TolB-like protein